MATTEEKPQSDWRARWKTRLKSNGLRVYKALKSYLLILALILILTVAYLWPRIFINVYPGEHGVLWLRFSEGTVLAQPYGEGLHILWPWDRMYVYNTRIQQVSHNFDALSRNGLPVRFEVSIRYRPQIGTLPRLHQEIGPEYVEKVVKPEVQAHVREVVANYLPEEIYTSEGLILQIIRQGALAGLDQRNIILDDLLIKRMELPTRIREAIEDKLTAEQVSLQYDFLLQKEIKEADRKRIEASGFRDFQRIVKQAGNFEEFLNLRGISASLELAKSPNSKVVVMGNAETGLPLVFSMPVERGNQSNAAQNSGAGTPALTTEGQEVRLVDLMDPATRELIEGMEYTPPAGTPRSSDFAAPSTTPAEPKP